MEYVVVPNDEYIDYEIIIDYYDSLSSSIDPLQNEMMENEGVDAENEGAENDVRVTVNTDTLPPDQK